MKKKVSYSNRYSDVIKFELIDSKTIIMTGGEYFRWGYPNDYSDAYEAYCADVDTQAEEIMTVEDFIKQIHLDRWYTEPDWKNPLAPYQRLVKSDTTRINILDPSGGPYLHEGHDMNAFGFGRRKPMIIDRFKFNEDGTKTIILK